MLGQTFSITDIPTVLFLCLVEILLSSDNAVAIASIASTLSKHNQKKALWVGFASSFILRAIGIVLASFLIRLFWVQMLGSLYLIFIGIKHLKFQQITHIKKSPSLFKTIVTIELTDLIFAIDSILAAFAIVGVSHSYHAHLPPKLWVIYLGGIIGVFFMRIAASFTLRLFQYRPNLQIAAFILVVWVGIKLFFQSSLLLLQNYLSFNIHGLHLISDWVFWIVAITILVLGMKKPIKDK